MARNAICSAGLSGWRVSPASVPSAAAATRTTTSTRSQSAITLTDERADGERADGERADRERADGERADGERADGERADGERADRQRPARSAGARAPEVRRVVRAATRTTASRSRVDGKRYEFPGSLGLAPEWGERARLVRRRVPALGVGLRAGARRRRRASSATISIRGDHRALRPSGDELRDYTDREATYYGNLFVDGQPRYLCLSPGKTSDERVCGDSLRRLPDDGRRLV